MERISNIQLFVLIFLFAIGSSTLFALGIGAKQDAWIVILLSYVISLGLLWVYTQIPKHFPNKNFSEILHETLGSKIAKPLLLLFGLYFLSQSLHNFYEFGTLIKMTALPMTPRIVIFYLFIFVTIYILNLGFEVFARTGEILVPYTLLFLVTTIIVNFFSDAFDLNNLRPILGNGFTPVMTELYTVVAFPFGEMVVFLMFWHFVKDQKSMRKIVVLAVGFAALLLALMVAVIISVLGTEFTINSEIPLLEILISIHVADIITNLDSVAVFLMFIGGFFKTALHFMGFSLAITWLFNGTNPKWVISIFGLFLPLIAIVRFNGLNDQRWKGMEGGIYSILLFSFLPILVLILIVLKEKNAARKENHNAN